MIIIYQLHGQGVHSGCHIGKGVGRCCNMCPDGIDVCGKSGLRWISRNRADIEVVMDMPFSRNAGLPLLVNNGEVLHLDCHHYRSGREGGTICRFHDRYFRNCRHDRGGSAACDHQEEHYSDEHEKDWIESWHDSGYDLLR